MHIYIFERPNGVDDGLDLSVFEQSKDFVDDVLHVSRAVLLVQQVAQVEAREGLVLVEQLDRRDFVDLPPLRTIKKNMFLPEATRKSMPKITERATLKKLLVSPVTTLDEPNKMYFPIGLSNP